MRRFTALYVRLDQTNSTSEKIQAMVDYFASAPAADAAWAIYFLTGRRLKRLIKRAELRQWVLAATGYQEWLLEETYHSVGDMAETIALLLPEPTTQSLDDTSLATWVSGRIQQLAQRSDEAREQTVLNWWAHMPADARFVLNKMLTGAFRVGVSQRLVVRALAEHFALDTAVIAHRLMGNWAPDDHLMAILGDPDSTRVNNSTPYPFFLASPLDSEPDVLGKLADWQVEWKWDGIRAQLIRRSGATYIWSRGEELLAGRFPEIEVAATRLPDGVVLDGEILCWTNDSPLPFASLQRRIGRLKPGATLLREAPVAFLAYDLLEDAERDLREQSLGERRRMLAALLLQDGQPRHRDLRVSPEVSAADWDALALLREESRARGVEGFMLKRRSSTYQVGRTRGDWWKWKIAPHTVDAVLIYAQPGSGRRSNLFTDYTFAVWDGNELVPVCKAYTGLNNEEISVLDKWIRSNTTERFGPVRAVEPVHVFEIAFDVAFASKRHRSGVAFRFPRIARWRRDLSILDADRLSTVQTLVDFSATSVAG